MEQRYDRKLILEDGRVIMGRGFGDKGSRICRLVFNTSMIGYQEIVSDPAYTDCAVLMTYPLIGSYGITDEDFESRVPSIGALIVGEYNDKPSNFRSTKTLAEILEENAIPGVQIDDTRALVRHIRDNGSLRILITDAETDTEEGKKLLAETPFPADAVSRVSCKKRWYARTPDHLYDVVVIDLGARQSIVRALNERSCNVTVVPWNASAAQILSMKPDGVVLAGGPGDPKDIADPVCETVASLRGKIPMFGIGLGCLAAALSYGADTRRMKCGHFGSNRPVRTLETNRVDTPSQTQLYEIDADSLAQTELHATHIDLLDASVEGIACDRDRVICVQFHPVCGVVPAGNSNLFDQFIAMMKEEKANA